MASEAFPMRMHYLFIFVVLVTFAASAQDWQACKPEGDYSFNDVKATGKPRAPGDRVRNGGGTRSSVKLLSISAGLKPGWICLNRLMSE